MGIDIHLHWNGMTEEDIQKQSTGFSMVHGHVGYLRQPYHSIPNTLGCYPISNLVPELYDEGTDEIVIDADDLKLRLPQVISDLYLYFHEKEHLELLNKVIKSYVDFVLLAEQKEYETGKSCTILGSY